MSGASREPSEALEASAMMSVAGTTSSSSMTSQNLPRLINGALPKLVVFDLDMTLISGDSTLLWTDWLLEKGVATGPEWHAIDREMAERYARGELDGDRALEVYLVKRAAALSGLTAEAVDALATEMARVKIAPLARKKGLALVAALRVAGIPMLVLSASASFLVKPVAREVFGIEDAIATDIVVENDHYTGRILGRAAFQDGKVERLREHLVPMGITPQEVLFLTDSRNDLPLARVAGGVRAVNPDPTLRAEAQKNGWPVLDWVKA